MLLRTYLTLACLICWAVYDISAQTARPIIAEDLYRLRIAADVDVSPDGRWVVFVVSHADSAANTYRSDLWIGAADGADVRRLTWTQDANESSPAFSPDGRQLAFVSRRAGDERSQIYVLPLHTGGEARPLTALETGASNPTWSPDGTRIAFNSSIQPESEPRDSVGEGTDQPLSIREKLDRNAANNDPFVITRLNFKALASIREERWDQIFVVDVTDHEAEPIQLTSGPFPHSGLSWNADGSLILYSASRSKGEYHPDYELDSDVWAIPAEAGSHHAELTGTEPVDPRLLDPAIASRADIPRSSQWSEFGASYSGDARVIAYVRRSLGEHMTARNSELMLMNPDGTNPRCVSCDIDRSVRSYDWDNQNRLYFTVADRGAVPLYRTGPDGSEPERIIDGPRGVLSFAVGGETIAWTEMNAGNPSEVYVSDLSGGQVRKITNLNAEFLSGVHVQPYEEMIYRAPDGQEIQGWVVRPPNYRPGAHPLAVEMHGGPHAMWGPGEQSMWHEYQMLAGAGYVVFFSNPRGSDGYGFEWKRVIHRNWGELPMGDVLAGADQVLARGWADPSRQVVTGGSYAGYLTAWIIGHTNRFDAAVAQRGVYDMHSWYGGSFTWRLFESEFATAPWEDPMLAWQASPVAYVKEINTPLLLIHGERDYTATIASAEMLYRFLKVLGKEVEFAWYPRASHELSRSGEPHQRIDRLMRIQEFFDRYLSREAAN